MASAMPRLGASHAAVTLNRKPRRPARRQRCAQRLRHLRDGRPRNLRRSRARGQDKGSKPGRHWLSDQEAPLGPELLATFAPAVKIKIFASSKALGLINE